MLRTTHLCRNFCSPQAVDIVDQLSTTFKICLCTTYIRNFLDYPSQLYWQRILRERQEQLKQARKPRSYASPKLRPTYSVTGVRCRATSVAKNKDRSIIGRFVRGWSIILETPQATLKMLKIVKIVKNLQSCRKLSELSKFVKCFEICQNCQKYQKKMKFSKIVKIDN